jgi:hypothetical protein
MEFQCILKKGKKTEKWKGRVEIVQYYGGHYELSILSRSSIRLLIGETSLGNFACIPDWNAGCYLSGYKDIFWNKERLTECLGLVDGVTAAYAISAFADMIKKDEPPF